MSNSDTPHTVPLEWMSAAKEIRERFNLKLVSNGVEFTDGLDAEIAAIIARHSPGWVKIEEGKPETWPPVDVDVYLWANHGWPTVGKRRTFRNGSWVFDNQANFPTACFTHWMLPAPPSEGETRK